MAYKISAFAASVCPGSKKPRKVSPSFHNCILLLSLSAMALTVLLLPFSEPCTFKFSINKTFTGVGALSDAAISTRAIRCFIPEKVMPAVVGVLVALPLLK